MKLPKSKVLTKLPKSQVQSETSEVSGADEKTSEVF